MDKHTLPAPEPAHDQPLPPQVITPEHHGHVRSQAAQLVTLAEGIDLFHSPEGEAYATITTNDHQETWPLRSRGFRQWLQYQYFLRDGRIPSSQGLQGALGVMEGHARFDSPEHEVFTHLAAHGGAIYLDLTNAAWEAVEVTAHGWQVVQRPPVKFLRRRGMLRLPHPMTGGALTDLRPS